MASHRALASVSVTHLFLPSDGRRGLAVAAVLVCPPNTIQLSLLSSNLFPPPGEAYPSDVLSLTISQRMLPEPPQFRVSLLPTRRRDYTSGNVALVSCQDVDAGLPVSSYACRPQATLIHSMPWVSISHRMLWEPPCRTSKTIFICQADRTHPSDEGVLCPSRRLHGPSPPDTALCPLISRGWRPVGPVRRLRELSHCRQLGSSWPGLQPHCSSIGGQGSPVPTRWAIAGPRLSPPWPVAPKPRSSLRRSVGPPRPATQVTSRN